ncbi:response regulator transcription factor [Paenibacillus tarimensis]|uniref:response regulator transcription factor n=1 Tax=Paenibacillus tarimensis TaxID=416012 RepID=UPI001F47D37F|nr:response regulator transcription factor [Paenibacillus tarimensis]MCF2944835.1 response regulator transcription factor [Paenibacillus tarimensis]
MYKVLIADDEKLIREGLTSIVDWEEQGFEIVGTAADGNDAYLKYQELHPHLMLVDIRMPEMNGLKLIELIREQDEQMHFIILSGYADFDYAKKAITSRVDGYILKPVDEDELLEYVGKVKAELDKQAVSAGQHNEEDKRNRLLQALFSGDMPDQVVVQSLAAELDLQADSYQVLMVLIEPDQNGRDQTAEAKRQFTAANERQGWGIATLVEGTLILLLREACESEAALGRLYSSIAEALVRYDIRLTLSLGDPVQALEQIKQSYEQASRRMGRRFFEQEGRIIYQSRYIRAEDKEGSSEEKGFQPAVFSENLYYALDIGNKQSMANVLEQAGDTMIRAGLNEEDIKGTYAQMVTTTLTKVAQSYPELRPDVQEAIAWIINLYKQPTLRLLQEVVLERLEPLADKLGSADSDQLVKKMTDLIQRNYGENLKLEQLAEVFNYNSAYLGKLFKNFTGEYFNTYLDKVRIEKAKELLDQGLKVYAVAERVGYTNVDYFHSKFKKYVGLSPSAYKKK